MVQSDIIESDIFVVVKSEQKCPVTIIYIIIFILSSSGLRRGRRRRALSGVCVGSDAMLTLISIPYGDAFPI